MIAMVDSVFNKAMISNPVWTMVGCLLLSGALYVLGDIEVLILWVSVLVGLLIGQAGKILSTLNTQALVPPALTPIMELARDQEIAIIHHELAQGLARVSRLRDPIFRTLTTPRLQSLVMQVSGLASGSIEYSGTETWRIAYEELLRSPGLHSYRSIAYIESAHYWQDGPGQQSTRLNLELQQNQTINIERTAIIADHLWPDAEAFPIEPLRDWFDCQHWQGIKVRLVRESALIDEPELLTDCGIYGNRAVGVQLADPAGRTIRFLLSFDFEKVRAAESIWDRLSVYTDSYQDLLDRVQRSS